MAHHSHLRTHRALDTIQARENPKIDIYDTHAPVDSPFPATPTMAPTSTGNFHRPVGTPFDDSLALIAILLLLLILIRVSWSSIMSAARRCRRCHPLQFERTRYERGQRERRERDMESRRAAARHLVMRMSNNQLHLLGDSGASMYFTARTLILEARKDFLSKSLTVETIPKSFNHQMKKLGIFSGEKECSSLGIEADADGGILPSPRDSFVDCEMDLSPKKVQICNFKGGNIPNTLTCPICITDYEAGDEITWSGHPSCSHVFHHECLVLWLTHNEECPCCRACWLPFEKNADEARSSVSSSHVDDNESNPTSVEYDDDHQIDQSGSNQDGAGDPVAGNQDENGEGGL